MPNRSRRLTERLSDYGTSSWRNDASVPAFPDTGDVIIFDGVCVLCSAFARFVARRDKAKRFRFIAAQSRLGRALFRHYGLDVLDFESNLLISQGRASAKLEAVAGILRHLGPGWQFAGNLMLLPPPNMRDWLYDRVAKNRYRLFGRTESCVVPDASWRDRLVPD